MMTMLPSGRAGQALASGLLALVLLLTWIVVVSPLIAWHADRSLLLQQRQELAARMALLTQSLPQLERQAAEGTGPVPGAIIEATSDAVAAAILQQAVQDMAARSGATLSSTEALPAEQLPGYRRIGPRPRAGVARHRAGHAADVGRRSAGARRSDSDRADCASAGHLLDSHGLPC